MKCQIDGAYWSYSTQAEMEGLWRGVDRIQPEAEIHQELQVPWKASTMKRNKFLLWCLIILFMMFSRQGYWSGLLFPSPVDHILSDLSSMTPPSSVVLRAWLGFIELDKAVVLVWLDWLDFCEYSFSVSAFWCPVTTPTIFLGFLLPWAWGISSWLFQESTAAAPYLGWGVSPYRHCSWPSTWDSSSRPSCACSTWVNMKDCIFPSFLNYPKNHKIITLYYHVIYMIKTL